MLNLGNIHSVTDFQRNPKGVLGRILETGDPVVLTVNGRATMVVQDASTYQKLLDKVREAEDLLAVREGLGQSLAGKGRPASEFFSKFEREHGL